MLLHAIILIVVMCLVSIAVQVGLMLVLLAAVETWERRVAPWLRAVVYLVRRPLAFRVMQAERDQARRAFEAATRISRRRAEAARRMEQVRSERHG